MTRPPPSTFFRQTLKSDADVADEIINISVLRPAAAVIVRLLYPTRVTPNQVTVFAILTGLLSAYYYAFGVPGAIACGGVLILLKDILDDVDGQLARAKQLYSRRGRFLDSIGDAVVDLAVFTSITVALYRVRPEAESIILGGIGLLGITLRVSYHVFYQASFLHMEHRYGLNRIIETVTDDDRRGDRIALRLQQIFNVIYRWQDTLMARIDHWCMGNTFDERHLPVWYGDRFGLRLSGLLGFGTELSLLAVCSWLNALRAYLWINAILMNGIWLASVLYRRLILSKNLERQ